MLNKSDDSITYGELASLVQKELGCEDGTADKIADPGFPMYLCWRPDEDNVGDISEFIESLGGDIGEHNDEAGLASVRAQFWQEIHAIKNILSKRLGRPVDFTLRVQALECWKHIGMPARRRGKPFSS